MSHLEETLPYTSNPLTEFCYRGSDYAKYRPSYPAAAIDIILEGIETPSPIAADVGAGTGISSRLLAERGVRVIAIEPNADMRQEATAHSRVEFREATAEATGLKDASVDLVTCFQSFHWFDLEPTLQEFIRIVKPSGKLAAVWNNWDENDEFTANYIHLVRIASNDDPPNDESDTTEESLINSYLMDIQNHAFPYSRYLDLTELIGLARSLSGVPLSGPVFQQFISDLQQLYARFCNERGIVSLIYSTNVYLAKPRPHTHTPENLTELSA